jgi:hypothetical protein
MEPQNTFCFSQQLSNGAAKCLLLFAAAPVNARANVVLSQKTVSHAALWRPNLLRSPCWFRIHTWGPLVFASAPALLQKPKSKQLFPKATQEFKLLSPPASLHRLYQPSLS